MTRTSLVGVGLLAFASVAHAANCPQVTLADYERRIRWKVSSAV